MNTQLTTQLLSRSLYKAIKRVAKDNQLARRLVALNDYRYYEDCIRNITVRKDDQEMSFIPANKPTIITNDAWSKEGRQTGKYGKILRKVVLDLLPNTQINDKEVEELVNAIKAAFSPGRFEVVSGEDIAKYYHEQQYDWDSNLGSLGESCMRHDRCQDYLDIYRENPDNIAMLIYIDGMGIKGRALIWQTDDGISFMDRIYGSDDMIAKFKQFAKDEGLFYKRVQSYREPTMFYDHNGNAEELKIQVSINPVNYNQVPYLDTMFYLDAQDGVLYNYPAEGAMFIMRDTGGGMEEGHEYALRPNTYLFGSIESLQYIDSLGGYVRSEDVVHCVFSDKTILRSESIKTACGNFIHQDYEGKENDWIVLLSNGSSAKKRFAKVCDFTGDRIIDNEATYIAKFDVYVREDMLDEAIAHYESQLDNE